ncbi:hypothetical protein KBI52_10875 [Microvirga sp. HBU67558]|uniref:hypothetical protein n=1 Tax=Microvirga sp. HBU67558 TaxID=2824562 RepID=UPI001B36796D|nr:hypothetical protein [Microvirga sp. HBU67558]MBQ0820708.1 hypothetical protein [Microvirga sp. HBU67558]
MTSAQYRKWRFYAESLIQQAIDILDAIDGDVDLEEGGDQEPEGLDEPAINLVEPWFRPAPAARSAAA